MLWNILHSFLTIFSVARIEFLIIGWNSFHSPGDVYAFKFLARELYLSMWYGWIHWVKEPEIEYIRDLNFMLTLLYGPYNVCRSDAMREKKCCIKYFSPCFYLTGTEEMFELLCWRYSLYRAEKEYVHPNPVHSQSCILDVLSWEAGNGSRKCRFSKFSQCYDFATSKSPFWDWWYLTLIFRSSDRYPLSWTWWC